MAGESDPRYKVPRVASRHDMTEILEQSERQWTGKEGERSSLRELATRFNIKLLTQVISDHDASISGPEIQAMYDTLSGSEGTAGDRTRVRRNLERHGVDVDNLEEKFVSHQAIHTYLTDGRGLSKPGTDRRTRSDALQTVERLRARLATVTESELHSLNREPDYTFGDPETIVTITVACNECNAHMELDAALQGEGCECSTPE